MSRGYQYKTADIIEALKKSHGLVFMAADILGCSPHTILRRAKKVRAVERLISQYREWRTDIAEAQLEKALLAGERWAVRFQLMTQGRSRGYVTRSEVGIRNADEDVPVRFSWEHVVSEIAESAARPGGDSVPSSED